MKILVTGATGFIGNHVVSRLLERNHKVIAIARSEDKARLMPWYDKVRFYSHNIHTPIDGLLELSGQVDALMHLAWPGLPNYKSLFHFEHNLPADYRFLKTMIEEGIKHVLVTGTCLEYGNQHGALAEDMPTLPNNPYALAKDTLDKFLQELRQVEPFILQWPRLFYLYGKGQNPQSLISQLNQAIENNDHVFNMSGGEQLRDYLPVEMVANKLVHLLEHSEVEGVINCCSGQPISVKSIVEMHLSKMNADIQLNLGHYPYPDYEAMEFWGNTDKWNRLMPDECDYL